MSEINYRHTARVSEDSWFIRLYLWLWAADVEEVDFCRLFWGYVFAVPNVLVRIVGYVPWKVGSAIGRRLRDWWGTIEQPTPREEELWREERAAKRHLRKATWSDRLSFVSATADKVVGFFQATWPVLKWPVVGLGVLFVGAMLAFAGYLLYLLGAEIVEHWDGFLLSLLRGLLILAISLLIASTLAFVIYFFSETRPGKAFRTGVKDSTLTFGGALRTGARGVKSRTCPKIEVV